MKITHFVLDVDGVLTDGRFHYTWEGKVMKTFGAHDSDGLKMVRDKLELITFITADERGFEISRARVEDMGYSLSLVSEQDRYAHVARYGFSNTAFMGDGFHDAPVLEACAFGFAPADARPEARAAADYVTQHGGGRGAVMDACLYLREFIL